MGRGLLLACCAAACWGAVRSAPAAPVLGPWEPIFQGVEHAVGTNVPGGDMPNQHVVHALRVDLRDPDIRLFSSPRLENYAAGSAETGGYTVSGFLAKHRLQVAVNGGLFSPGDYYLPAGTPMDISGFSVSEGTVVSAQGSRDDLSTIVFTADKVPTVIPTNWPAVSAAGIHTAIPGSYPLLVGGVNLGARYLGDRDFIHRTNPRTVMGTSADGRWLLVVIIDGRQPGYSVGANDYESGAWLVLLGASEGINLDGGGSSTLVVEDSFGQPLRLNRSSAVADSGRERTVGSHFGIYARPVPGFINDVEVTADDLSAGVSWTTVAPAIGRVRYGTTPDLSGQEAIETPPGTEPATRHAARLSGLTPGTAYYYQVLAQAGTEAHASVARTFVTSNYVTTAVLFDVTHEWRYATANLEGTAWTARDYDDSAWAGPGAGLLWVDGRGGARSGVEPANTQMPLDPSTGFPYSTYYFRTHFQHAGGTGPGVSLVVTNYVDDGAVFYLNGAEVYRLRMEAAPAPIGYGDLAVGYGCAGDATCATTFTLDGAEAGNLVAGDNVLAVEVHNYNARSPDTTFGISLTVSEPRVIRPTMEITASGGSLVIRWDRPGFLLQSAADAAGPWEDVAGPVTESPHALDLSGSARFYRLRNR